MLNKKTLIITAFLLLTVAILFFVPKALAILKNSASGTENIDLAEWSISLNPDPIDNSMDLVSGVTNETYTLTVTSQAEVDIDYTIVISNLPSGVKVKFDDEANFRAPTNNTITIDAGSILYSDATKVKTHLLEFKSDAGTAEISNRQIGIDVVAKQKL